MVEKTTEEPELTPTQQCQLAGIEKFLGKKLNYMGISGTGSTTASSEVVDHATVYYFGVTGKTDIEVNTYVRPPDGQAGAITESTLFITKPDGTMITNTISDGAYGSTTFHYALNPKHDGPTYSLMIENGVPKPFDGPYRPPNKEELKFYEDVTGGCMLVSRLDKRMHYAALTNTSQPPDKRSETTTAIRHSSIEAPSNSI